MTQHSRLIACLTMIDLSCALTSNSTQKIVISENVPLNGIEQQRVHIIQLVSISSDFISSELSALWLVAATANWVVRREVTQFTLAATHPVYLNEVKWHDMSDMNAPLDIILWLLPVYNVLWHCWLGIRVMRCWRGCLSGVWCKWLTYGPADATSTPSFLASLESRIVPLFWCRLTPIV